MRAAQHGNFITWPGLTPHNIAKHFTMTMATAKGHLNHEQKIYNLQSTKQIPTPGEEAFMIKNVYFPLLSIA